MARLFDDGSSEYLEIDSAVIIDYPFTMACWFYWDDDSVAAPCHMMFVGDKDVGTEYHTLSVLGSSAGDPVIASSRSTAAGSVIAGTSSGSTVSTWHHACGVFTSATARAAFIDGGSKGTNVVSCTPAGLNRTSIARAGDSSPGFYWPGRLAEAAAWDTALTDAEVAILAAGFSPLFVRPQSLVAYWPLIRDEDQDRVGGYDLTAYNAPSIASHPPIIYPAPPHIAYIGAAAPPPTAALPIFPPPDGVHSLVFGGVTVR